MTIKPKPIQTHYKGFWFRSRNEARWSIVFDLIQVVWQYEPEGYSLPPGAYLIDFYMPPQIALTTELYVETKGIDPNAEERSKARELSKSTELPVIILSGQPGLHNWFLYYNDLYFDSTLYSREVWWSFAGIRSTEQLMQYAYKEARSARFEFGDKR